MAARDYLNNLQFKYSFTPPDEHEIMAFGDKGQVGRLLWADDDGEITHLHVGEPVRRHGVATDMWHAAHSEAEERGITPPEHSSRRTQDGDAWAQAVGGDVPELSDDVDGWSSDG